MSRSLIDRPIFLLGSGRSGTTVLYNFMAVHPQLCWFSNVSNRFAWLPCAPLSHRVLDFGGIGKQARRHIVGRRGGRRRLGPVEAEMLYDMAGFVSNRRSTEADYDPEVERRFRQIVERHLRWSGKPRFLSKQTANNQRYRLLNRMFPDALFVHLIRDGRAVANSIRGQRWLETMDLWWLQDKAANHVEEYGDPIELCGLHWQHNVNELLQARELLGERYCELRYEDLVHDVHGFVRTVLDFCQLEAPAAFLELLPAKLPDMNNKWRDDLSDQQIQALQKVIGPSLEQLGYPV